MTEILRAATLTQGVDAGPQQDQVAANRLLSRWMAPIEGVSAALTFAIVVMLFSGVVSRYVFSKPITWIDEAVSFAFIWVAMLGAVLAMHRNEHLRLSMFVDRMPARVRGRVHAFAFVAVAALLMGLINPAIEHAKSEWIVNTPSLELPAGLRVAAIAVGLVLMLAVVAVYALRTVSLANLVTPAAGEAALVALGLGLAP
jgi:TRAP-type C4-dicarboxylate transport system permease small subunit